MLNHLIKYAGTIALIAGANLLSTQAHAAAAAATAGIFGIDGGSLLTFSNDQYLSDASTPLHSGFNASSSLQNYFFNDTPSFASIDNSLAPAPQTSAGAVGNGSGSASVLWSFDWVATGNGTATFDAEYLYSATVANLVSGETGIASASVSAVLEGTQNKKDVLFYFNNQNGNTFGDEHLTLNFDVVAGQTGTISITVASNAIA
ncbi:MAG TPA: hypothetical protein VGK97_14405, partial [Spongiibacteraceae bacterium]